jgi:hypothetical protein
MSYNSKKKLLSNAFFSISKIVYDLIGRPDPNNPKFANLNKMIRVFVGIHDRQVDINAKTTYFVDEIINVDFMFSFFINWFSSF